MATELFTRQGTAPTAPVQTDAKGRSFFVCPRPCSRCGGAGRSDRWAFTGYTCFDCGGAGAAANKAWETRRLRGHNGAHNSAPVRANVKNDVADQALAAFEREAQSDMPDWHRAALALKQALARQDTRKTLARARPVREPTCKPLVLPPSRWHDYPVDRVNSFSVRTDILVVTFADGEVVRAPAVSAKGKPTNVGRGLRIAVAFYQARTCWRRGIRFRAGVHPEVPAIAACVCEDSGETFDAGECTVRTIEARAAQDWKIRR